ncbi:hypothetical protein [Jannaschia aquimarina]|uniref:Uncharacterized protein n=1 Tax=Jannaschia aquimarina TaxID=935700 RepID=A0A0D1D7T9_9RHOB|nr:hypothetical protein [Jannaschia aquimarina]KIT16033.1 hypothetical protein jaqu_23030 [Jannaschia aquimarina]SNT00570.1 hypothetical protein SAMN05421775_104214 [Jannaschia aquimarina]
MAKSFHPLDTRHPRNAVPRDEGPITNMRGTAQARSGSAPVVRSERPSKVRAATAPASAKAAPRPAPAWGAAAPARKQSKAPAPLVVLAIGGVILYVAITDVAAPLSALFDEATIRSIDLGF